MKRIFEAIDVTTKKGWPQRIRWRGRTYLVKSPLDYWILQSRWWAQEERRVYFRLQTGRALMDVFRSRKKWVLARLQD